ncbi:hypothetical protein GPECTOR_4g921 [Gonium pectorale]|uniref:Ricin B lectin domain-containing protein n=1 Tax=Gonium pectorale TaxID=33097 RepID=A0A150GYD0_GONPE|nr:hypothetical protein GPECTOR_4g921 [Gonium pectorale]|eukprot:KXZ54849.1 hypothetical protein GPECTOR_4g921 [Gonium pectorale]
MGCPAVPGYDLYPGVDISGFDIAAITSPADGASKCNANPACNSFNYGPSSGSGNMKTVAYTPDRAVSSPSACFYSKPWGTDVYIIKTSAGLCLSALTSNGAQVVLATCDASSSSQKFIFKQYGSTAGSYSIALQANPSKCLDVPGSSPLKGTPIAVWDCNLSVGETFRATLPDLGARYDVGRVVITEGPTAANAHMLLFLYIGMEPVTAAQNGLPTAAANKNKLAWYMNSPPGNGFNITLNPPVGGRWVTLTSGFLYDSYLTVREIQVYGANLALYRPAYAKSVQNNVMCRMGVAGRTLFGDPNAWLSIDLEYTADISFVRIDVRPNCPTCVKSHMSTFALRFGDTPIRTQAADGANLASNPEVWSWRPGQGLYFVPDNAYLENTYAWPTSFSISFDPPKRGRWLTLQV